LFPKADSSETVITLRVGTSFISEAQARKNIDEEIPDRPTKRPGNGSHFDPGTFENTAYLVRKSWAQHLDRVELSVYADGRADVSERDFVDQQAFWTGVVHTLQVCAVLCFTSSI